MPTRRERLTVDDVHGAWCIIPTPATDDAGDWRCEDSIDYDEVAKAVDGLINAGMDAIMANLEEHLAFQGDLETRGIMFGAGPFPNDAGDEWGGEGMVIIRADSLAHAKEIAAADPMHSSGAREFTVRPWLLNEGSLNIKISFSDGKGSLT